MNGTIYFDNIQDLADFLKHYTGGTATFEVYQKNAQWQLTFLGGF